MPCSAALPCKKLSWRRSVYTKSAENHGILSDFCWKYLLSCNRTLIFDVQVHSTFPPFLFWWRTTFCSCLHAPVEGTKNPCGEKVYLMDKNQIRKNFRISPLLYERAERSFQVFNLLPYPFSRIMDSRTKIPARLAPWMNSPMAGMVLSLSGRKVPLTTDLQSKHGFMT